MMIRIARKEWLDMWRDGRFRVASTLVALLLLASLALGASHQSVLKTERDTANKISRAQWLAQSDKDPHQATHHGLYIVKSPSTLSLFDPGVSEYAGSAILLESHKQSEATLRGARDTGLAGRFGQLSASTVLQLLLPLLIILLGFGAFAGERESGTLRQVLALGVAGRDLAWGKTLGIIGALSALLVPATSIGVVALLLSSSSQNTSASALIVRAGLLTVTYGLYFGIFTAVTLAVSARSQTSRGALVSLVGFWIFSSLFAPRLASDAVRAQYPTPSALEFTSWVEKAKDAERGTEKPRQIVRKIQTRLMKQYGVSKVEDLPVNWHGVLSQHSEDGANRAFGRVYGRLWRIFAQQNAVYERAALSSPLLGVRAVSMALSDSDWEAHRHFYQRVETYRRDWVRLMNADWIKHPTQPGEEYKAGPALWASVPPFEYETLATHEILRAQKASIATLGLWFVASLLALMWSTARMRVS